jgi:hypothetical protein
MAAAIMEIPPPNIIPPFGFGKHEKPQCIISSSRGPIPLPTQSTISYVDDLSASLCGKDIRNNTSNLSITAQNLSLRAHSLNLTFSADKTEFIHLFRHTSHGSLRPKSSDLPNLPNLETPTTPTYLTALPSDQIKILGVTIDSSLSFSPHIANAASSGMQALGSFRFLRTTSLGISSKTARYLTISAILPKMLYGSEIWWLGNVRAIDPIRIVYNRIARWITGLPSNTRITKLLSCANLPPLEKFLDYTSTCYGIRLLFLPTTNPATIPTTLSRRAKKYPGTDRILSLIEGMYTNRLEDRSSPSPYPISLSPTKIHFTRSPDAKSIHEAWIHTLSSTSLRLYTDGSKSSTGTTRIGLI